MPDTVFHFDLYALHLQLHFLWYYNYSTINISHPFLDLIPDKISPWRTSPEKGLWWMHRAKKIPRTTTHACKRREAPPGFNPYPPAPAYTYPCSTGCNHSYVSAPLRSRLHISDCHGDCFLLCSAAAAKRTTVLGLKWLKRKQQSAVEKGRNCDWKGYEYSKTHFKLLQRARGIS